MGNKFESSVAKDTRIEVLNEVSGLKVATSESGYLGKDISG